MLPEYVKTANIIPYNNHEFMDSLQYGRTYRDGIDIRFMARERLFAHSISNVPHLSQSHNNSNILT